MSGKKAVAEVFSTINGKIFQDNEQLRFILEWQGEKSVLKMPCYFGLKKRIDAINVETMLEDPSTSQDVEIIAPCGCDRCFVLTVPEIIEFKSLLAGAKVMMELNSIIYERLHRPVFCHI